MMWCTLLAVLLFVAGGRAGFIDDTRLKDALVAVLAEELTADLAEQSRFVDNIEPQQNQQGIIDTRQSYNDDIDPEFGGRRQYPPTNLNRKAIEEMKTFLRGKIQENARLIPELVRLAFHTCGAGHGCNGCINTTTFANKDLAKTFQAIQNWRQLNYRSLITQADFVALAAYVAGEVGLQNAGCRTCTFQAFKINRRTCSINTVLADLPDGRATDGISQLMNLFRLTRPEAIVLLGGGHSVGGCISACNGGFDNTPNALDNKWFVNVRDTQNFVFQPENGRIFWRPSPADGTRMILTSDLAAGWNVTVDGPPNFRPNCPAIRSCTALPDLSSTIPRFARDGALFYAEFMQVYNKMLETVKGIYPLVSIRS